MDEKIEYETPEAEIIFFDTTGMSDESAIPGIELPEHYW